MRIAVICGSMRESLDRMRLLEVDLTNQRLLTLFPVPLEVEDHDAFADAMHLCRIAFASDHQGILAAVPKPDGSFGVSTKREIEFALSLGMKVHIFCWADMEPDAVHKAMSFQAELDGLDEGISLGWIRDLIAQMREEAQHAANQS